MISKIQVHKLKVDAIINTSFFDFFQLLKCVFLCFAVKIHLNDFGYHCTGK